jgi:CRP/FNR family transcriptional activator FtrB
MRENPLEIVRKLSLFSGVEDEVIEHLALTSLYHSFPEGVELIRAGDRFSFLYGLTRGKVESKAQHNGVETILYIVRPGFCFAHSSVLLDEPAFASSVTVERSDILMIPADSVRHAVRNTNGLSYRFACELARTTSLSAREILNQKLRSAVERLAIRILREQKNAPDTNVVDFGLSKRQLAAAVGASPETLSRALNVLRNSGVDVSGNRFVVLDPSALRDLARPALHMDGPI